MPDSSPPPVARPAMVPVRRKDRVMNDEGWITEFLRKSPAGVLALTRDGQPFINMNAFVFDESQWAIYTHTAKSGATRSHIEEPVLASFGVFEMGRLLPAPHALNFSVEYAGVVCFGTVAVVEDPVEATFGLQLLLDKYSPHLQVGVHYRPIQPDEIERTAVYRFTIDRWSGKRKEAPADQPGAFRFGEPAVPPWSDWRLVAETP